MGTSLWIAVSLAAVIAAGYALGVRGLYMRSRRVDKQIDFTKIRPLPDEDGKD